MAQVVPEGQRMKTTISAVGRSQNKAALKKQVDKHHYPWEDIPTARSRVRTGFVSLQRM